MTGVVGAWLDSIPMLVLSGQIRTDWTARMSGVHIRALGDQEFDICKSVAAMTKYCEMVTDPLRIRYCLEKALYLAESGRPGPTGLTFRSMCRAPLSRQTSSPGFDPENYEAGATALRQPRRIKFPRTRRGGRVPRQRCRRR